MVKGLRKWTWGDLPVYNGFTHVERVRGWQLIMWRIDNGWFERAATCCITGQTHQLRLHSELYYSPEGYVLNQATHFALHRRFKQSDQWRRIVDRYARTGDEWFARLSLVHLDLAGELRAKHGSAIADIFARAPIPLDIPIPYHQIYRQPPAAD